MADGKYRKPIRTTLADYLRGQWLTERTAHMKQGALSARSWQDYGRAIDKLVLHFGALQLDAITKARVAEIRRTLVEHYQPVAAQRAFDVFRMAMRRAFQLDVIPVNPATAEPRVKTAPPRTAVLTVEQVHQFLAAAEAYRFGRDAALFHVLLLGGLRPGEALALRWSDLDGSCLRVERAVTSDADGALTVGPTKTRSSRQVHLPAAAVETLTAHRQRQLVGIMRGGARRAWDAGGQLMFPNDGGQLRSIDSVRDAWRAILRKAALPAVRLYDARHSYVSALLHAGVDVKTVSQLAGHKDPAMTLRRYAHATPASLENAAARLEAALGQAGRARQIA